MKNKDFIHLPELYLKFGTLKNHLKKLYKLKLVPMESKELTEEIQAKIEEKLESQFLEQPFIHHYFGEVEDPEFDYSTPITDEQKNYPQVSITFRIVDEMPVNNDLTTEQYNALKKEINKWAIPNGLDLIGVFQHKGINETSISFTIHDIEKAVAEVIVIENPIDKYIETISRIEDRLQKITKHIKKSPVDSKWFALLDKTLALVGGIESGIDADLNAPPALPGANKKTPVKRSIAILKDKDGKILDKMEVLYPTEEYAKSAFAAARIKVRPLDKITFES